MHRQNTVIAPDDLLLPQVNGDGTVKAGGHSNSSIDAAVRGGLSALVVLTFSSATAWAETITATCEKEDAIVVGWNGPLTIIYDGDATGTLKVEKSEGEKVKPSEV